MVTYGRRVNFGYVVARRWFRAQTAASFICLLRRRPWRYMPKKMTSKTTNVKHARIATGNVTHVDF
jgi:hypothetical protein